MHIELFWIKAHAGHAGNERADQLAKEAAVKSKIKPIYDRCPISFVKKGIRLHSIELWNARYLNESAAEVTKAICLNAKETYLYIKKPSLKPEAIQIVTGHGAFAAYLYKFKRKDSPACIYDGSTDQTSMHVLIDCPVFYRPRQDFPIKTEHTLNVENLI